MSQPYTALLSRKAECAGVTERFGLGRWTLNVNDGKNGIKSGARRYANKQAAEQALTEFNPSGH